MLQQETAVHWTLHRSLGRAITVPASNLCLSYGQLATLAGQVTRHLKETGAHGAIAIVMPNVPECILSFLGIINAGLAAAPLNPAYKESEFLSYLSDLPVSQLLVLPSHFSASLESATSKLGIPTYSVLYQGDGLLHIEQVRGGFESVGRPMVILPPNTALLLHTSGTTSRPKVVPLTDENLHWSATHLAEAYELGENDRCMLVMPLFHVHGLVGCLLATILSGGMLILCEKFQASTFLETMSNTYATWYSAVPSIHQILLSKPDYLANSQQMAMVRSNLRLVRSCSSPLSPDLAMRLAATFGVPIVQAYGMSESAHLAATQTLQGQPIIPGSVGKPLGCQMSIRRTELGFEECEADEVGEVCIKGPSIIKAYLSPSEANSQAFTKDGFFRTGDFGRFDRSGNLYLCGRIKEMINRGGEKINPLEIDVSLAKCPLISEAYSFALPDPIYGETVACIAILSSPMQERQAKMQIARHCETHMAKFKCPEHIFIVDAIPKTATGKVQRQALSRLFSNPTSRPSM